MQSIAYIPASDGAANASLMTVSTVRAPLASTILVNTVASVPAKFYASMGTPNTFIDPVTGETITVISEATAVDFAGHINGSNIEIDEIAPGYTDNGSKVGDIIIIRPITEWANNIHNLLSEAHNDDGSIKAEAVIYEPTVADHISTGGVWSTLTGLNAAMTALVGYQAGYRGAIAAVASRAFTASKDTYVDVLRTLSGYTNTFTLVYTEVANGAASPALAANSVRIAKVVTGASTISSITQRGGDSLGNPIYPFKPTAPIIYSTTEQLTGDIWVDGRPVYRKVIRGQVSLVNGTANVAHGIANLTTAWELLSAFVGTKYTATSNNGSQIIIGAHRETAGNWNHVDNVDMSNISWVGSFGWGNSYFTAVLEYVK